MPDINAWSGNSFPLADWVDDADEGVDTARLISDNAVSIVVSRIVAGTTSTLDAQTVAIEPLDTRTQLARGASGQTGRQAVLVLGYKGHPSLADTDLQVGDRFAYDDHSYQVSDVLAGLTDSLQAIAEVRG